MNPIGAISLDHSTSIEEAHSGSLGNLAVGCRKPSRPLHPDIALERFGHDCLFTQRWWRYQQHPGRWITIPTSAKHVAAGLNNANEFACPEGDLKRSALEHRL